jgi:hypothetical protein
MLARGRGMNITVRLLALGLAVLIVLMGRETMWRRAQEARLEAVEADFAEGRTAPAMEAVWSLLEERLTERQHARAAALVSAGVLRLHQERPFLQRIGARSFDPSHEALWIVASPRVAVTARKPSGAPARGLTHLQVGGQEAPFEGHPPEATISVALGEDGTERRLRIGLRAAGLASPIPLGELLFRVHLEPPGLVLHRVGEDASSIPPEAGRIVLEEGTGLRVAATDPEGLGQVAATLGPFAIPLFFAPAATAVEFEVPVPIPDAESGRTVQDLHILAENLAGSRTERRILVEARRLEWTPVTAILVDGRPVPGDAPFPVRNQRPRLELRVPGADAHALPELGLWQDAGGIDLHQDALGLSATLALEPGRITTCAVTRRGHPCRRFSLVLDTTPPQVEVAPLGAQGLAPGRHRLSPDAVLLLCISDEHGLDPHATVVEAVGLEPGPREDEPGLLVQTFTLRPGRAGRLAVSAMDRAGNASETTTHEFECQARLRVVAMGLAEGEPGLPQAPRREPRLPLQLRWLGEGEATIRVRDGRGLEAIAALLVPLDGSGSGTFEVDLRVPPGAEELRLVDVPGAELPILRVVVDRSPPRLDVAGARAEPDGGFLVALAGGEALQLRVHERFGLSEFRVDGAETVARHEDPEGSSFVLRPPPDRPARVEIHATDLAGHAARQRFLLVAP